VLPLGYSYFNHSWIYTTVGKHKKAFTKTFTSFRGSWLLFKRSNFYN